MTYPEFYLRDEFEADTHPLNPPTIAWRLWKGESTEKKGLQWVVPRPPAALFSPMIPSHPGEGREGQGRWGGILFITSQILNMGCVKSLRVNSSLDLLALET